MIEENAGSAESAFLHSIKAGKTEIKYQECMFLNYSRFRKHLRYNNSETMGLI